MIPIPKLPAGLLAVLGVLATLAAILEPHLSGQGRVIADIVLAVLSLLGIIPANKAIREHGQAQRAAGARAASR